MRAHVLIRLKPAILDPQGKAVYNSLRQLGYHEVNSVRIGKLVDLEIDGENMENVSKRVHELSDKLLANPLMETFDIEFEDDDNSR